MRTEIPSNQMTAPVTMPIEAHPLQLYFCNSNSAVLP